MSICLSDTYNLYFESTDCVQAPTQTITLNLVYQSQTYWNSALVLPYYGCTIQWWADIQFHLLCQYTPSGSQKFWLWWVKYFRPNSRTCSVGTATNWTFVSNVCDPFQLEYSTEEQIPGEGCRAADDCFTVTDPSFYATITEP